MNGKLIGLIVVVGLIQTVFGCNGYKAIIHKMENCAGPNSIISIDDDFTVKLNKKCELVPSGCVSNKAFTTATAKYIIKKDNIVIKEEEIDICEAAGEATKEAKSFMKVFSMPEKCPVPEEKICANDHRFDLSKYKTMLSMAKGKFQMQAQIKHDTGESCLNIEMEIIKAK